MAIIYIIQYPLKYLCALYIGYHTWNLLHTMVAHYPDEPSLQQQQDVDQFFKLLSRLYPCQICAHDFAKL